VLPGADVEVARVALPELDDRALVAWRLGMAHIAPFVTSLPESERHRLVDEAVSNLDGVPLVRSMIVLRWERPA
jgi:hypothetical protein